MADYWKILWRRLYPPSSALNAEVERITALQRTAAARRAEHEEKRALAALTADASLAVPLAASRKRVEEAEAAHTAALQKWENRQSRQKSR